MPARQQSSKQAPHLAGNTDTLGYIIVDDQLRTSLAGIWALGDCNGKGAFTHTSYNDFEIVAANLLDGDRRRVSDRLPAYAPYTTLQRAVHIHPTVSELIPTILAELKPRP